MGIANKIMLATSEGVISADKNRLITIAYLLLSAKNLELTIPIFARKYKSTGNSNINPDAKVSKESVDK